MKDEKNLISFSKELQGANIKLIISSNELMMIESLSESHEELDTLLHHFGKICSLPRNIERPYVERTLVRLSSSNRF